MSLKLNPVLFALKTDEATFGYRNSKSPLKNVCGGVCHIAAPFLCKEPTPTPHCQLEPYPSPNCPLPVPHLLKEEPKWG